MIVRDVMTENPLFTRPETKLGEAADLLAEREIRHLPVVENDALVGMLSDRDVRALIAPKLVDDAALDELKARYDSQVSEVMVPDVVTLHPETELGESIDVMLDQKVGALPVVDPGTGQLLGIVSYVDLLRAVRDKV